MPDYFVIFDGTRNAPLGRQMFTEEYEPTDPTKNLRTRRQLAFEEIEAILTAAALGVSSRTLALQYRVGTNVIDTLVIANQHGMLRRGQA